MCHILYLLYFIYINDLKIDHTYKCIYIYIEFNVIQKVFCKLKIEANYQLKKKKFNNTFYDI